ncbi:Matrin-3 [Triplophysa tibetana]|uniref:Matrin-3 n=1 Tax=Triplophysa tibetana TaxID=1572043 RepID=A0A5A9P6K3_9TELE|nr:Matrin-3 [Triplophysa tibetana]
MESVGGEDVVESETINVQSLYTTLGLSPEDVDALAQIPESEISVETLPYLIMQLKAKRANKISAATDTDYRNKPRISQEKPDTPESRTGDRRRSPPSSSSRRSGSYDHEHYGKGEGHRSTGEKSDSRYRMSSHERQSGDDVAVEAEVAGGPTEFPTKCSLCKCVVNSIKTWKEHLLGVRHKKRESSRQSSRSSQPPKRPYSSHLIPGDPSQSTTLDHFHPPKPKTRVVVAKFPMGAVSVEELLVLGRPFGTIIKHLVFPAKGFLEFSSHKEAQSMISHYQMKPAFVKENRVTLYLSPTVEGVHSPPKFDEPLPKRAKRPNPTTVVCFSHLPPGDVETEVLKLVGMFGRVRQSKFMDCKALVEMVNWRDADIMVKYYYINPLRMQGKSVKVDMTHITSLRENSPDRPSKKSDSSTNSKSRDESSGSKEKGDGSSQDVTEKDEEERRLEDEEGIQMEDEPGLIDDTADDVMMQTEDEKIKTEEEPFAEEEREENRARGLEEHPDEQDGFDDTEFPENFEDFVTLDELDSTAGEAALGKVVVVWPVRKTPDLLKELCRLCAPFGSIVKHTASVYRQEAMMELETEEIAEEMVRYYKEHKATLWGSPVSISMSLTMKTIESPSGRSIFISCLPTMAPAQQRYTHMNIFHLVKSFGKLTGYFLNKKVGTCYIQFEKAKSAEKIVSYYMRRPCKFWGSLLKVDICRKGDSLIRWRTLELCSLVYKKKQKPLNAVKTEREQANKNATNKSNNSSAADCEGVCGDPACEDKASEDIDEQDKSPLGPYEPEHAVGVNYVIPVTGFFCKLCNVFYSDETKANSEHCKSLEHYNNLKVKRGEAAEQSDGQPDQTIE